jgi:hypothetical protein
MGRIGGIGRMDAMGIGGATFSMPGGRRRCRRLAIAAVADHVLRDGSKRTAVLNTSPH